MAKKHIKIFLLSVIIREMKLKTKNYLLFFCHMMGKIIFKIQFLNM